MSSKKIILHLLILFMMIIWYSNGTLFINKTVMFLTSSASNETIARVKKINRYCEYPTNLKSRPRLYEPGTINMRG